MTETLEMDFSYYIREGHKALQAHNFWWAKNELMLAESVANGADQLIEARHSLGIVQRMLGEFGQAYDTLGVALKMAQKARNHEEISAIWRDHGEVSHDLGLRFAGQSTKDRDLYFKEAEIAFEESLAVARKYHLFKQEGATLSFFGMLKFDWGQKYDGIVMLRDADRKLGTLDNPVYEINSLIRLMRCSFVDRWKNLPRALRLTNASSDSHADRKKVYVALLGNKVFLDLKARYLS